MEAALWLGEPDRAASIAEHFLARLGESFFANWLPRCTPTRSAPRPTGVFGAGTCASSRPSPAACARLRTGLASLMGPGAGPEVHAWVALAHAEADRAEGLACASSFAEAADRFSALAIPFRAAYARLREAKPGSRRARAAARSRTGCSRLSASPARSAHRC